MKKYLKTLLPYRWIAMLLFIIWGQTALYLLWQLGTETSFIIWCSILNIPFWVLVDIVAGIGRRSPLFK